MLSKMLIRVKYVPEIGKWLGQELNRFQWIVPTIPTVIVNHAKPALAAALEEARRRPGEWVTVDEAEEV